MKNSELPALYQSADSASNTAQKTYLAVVRAEYFFLISLAVLGEFQSENSGVLPTMLVLIVFLFGLLIYRFVSRLDRKWYACRALAESIKTSAWKFSMRAHPFEDSDKVQVPVKNFLNALIAIRKDNEFTGHELEAKYADKDQITDDMLNLRKLGLIERLKFYNEHRIQNQRTWYAKKAVWNNRKRKFWFLFAIICYAFAAVSLLSGSFSLEGFSNLFPGLIVLVTSSFAWIQVKRFGELSTSYTLTAHEIGGIQGRLSEVTDEASLSEFVNSAELAFSREHTQWAARRDFA